MSAGNGNNGGNGSGPVVQVKDVVKTFPVGGGVVTILKYFF